MGILTSNYPSGPCGKCGAIDSVVAYSTKEWVVDSHHPEGGYYYPQVSAECQACGASPYSILELKECFGGQRGYAVGLSGPQFSAALQKAGWTKVKMLEV